MCHARSGPRAVEAVLRRHPCVLDAAAVEITDRTGKPVMAAVVSLAMPVPDSTAELDGYCRRHLPAAQVPTEWVIATEGLADRPRIPLQGQRAPHLDLLPETTPRPGTAARSRSAVEGFMSADRLRIVDDKGERR
jgi:acyl-CoA synthetase (AMP-forming)/AMP-acid ligase II